MAHTEFIEQLKRDLRHTMRMLPREPVFVGGVILTFALAIGANATMFGLVDRLMLSAPSGIAAPAQVEELRFRTTLRGEESFAATTTSYPNFTSLRSATSACSAVAATRNDSVTIGRDALLTQIPISAASGDFFRLLKNVPAAGRFFGPSDDELPLGNSVIVLGYDYWQRTLAGERGVIGRELIVNDQPFTIIGVASKDFNGDGVAPVDAYIPLAASLRNRDGDWVTDRNLNLVSVVARLRDRVGNVAAAQIATAALRDESSSGGQNRSTVVELESIVPGANARTSPQSQIAVWLTGVALIVLVIATANVATLFAVRATKRRRELAVHLALGAAHRAAVARRMPRVVGVRFGGRVSTWALIRAVVARDIVAERRRILVVCRQPRVRRVGCDRHTL